jgi:uracil-DNA glycosylase
MGLDLDARQRAMLAEMKVPLWWPETAPTEPAVAPVVAHPSIANIQESTRAEGQKDPDNFTPHGARQPAPRAAPAVAAATRVQRSGEGIEQMDWPALKAAVAGCQACVLCERRRHTVFGVGDPTAEWMFVGEAPGENEDLQGEPFVGQAGHLLDNMLKAIGLSRSAGAAAGAGEAGGEGHASPPALRGAYIANVIKCRPPGNRNPEPGEVAQCEPFLARQVALVRPKILVAMGRFAASTLLAGSVPGVASVPLGKLRGQVYRYQGIPVVVTYHPAYLLRTLSDKAKAWADLCLALDVAEGVHGAD